MNGTRKTLVILTPAFPDDESPVFLVQSQQLMVKSLKKNFPETNIIVVALLLPQSHSQSQAYTWYGVDVIPIDGLRYRRLLRPIRWSKAWRALKKINNSSGISGILSFWCSECAFIGHRFAKRHSIKHITWICGQDARRKNK